MSELGTSVDIPPHHLLVAGFPCEDYSVLKREVTTKALQASLDRFDHLVRIISACRPIVVILENVASLMHAGLGWVRAHIEDSLKCLAIGRYVIFRDVVCCTSFRARFTRPRVYWVMFRVL